MSLSSHKRSSGTALILLMLLLLTSTSCRTNKCNCPHFGEVVNFVLK